jgi:hypothetical protein
MVARRTAPTTALLSALLVFLLFLPSQGCSQKSPAPSGAGAPAVQKPFGPLPAGAKAIRTDYETNEVAADVKYKGHDLRIPGVVEAIRKDAFDHIFVVLDSGEPLHPVECLFDDSETAQGQPWLHSRWSSSVALAAGYTSECQSSTSAPSSTPITHMLRELRWPAKASSLRARQSDVRDGYSTDTPPVHP